MDRPQRIMATQKWLCEVAKPVADKAEFSRWLNANNADTDQAEDWCTDCATAEVDRLNAENPDGDYFVDGGWGCRADTPPCCHRCGKPLDDHLPSAGIEYEMDHYSRHHVKATPGAAHGFCQMLASSDFDEKDPMHWKFFLRLERLHKRTVKPNTSSTTPPPQKPVL